MDFDLILEAFLRGFLVVTQSLVLERSLAKLKERKDKLFSTCSFYHHLIVKVGVLHPLFSFVHDVYVVSCLVHAYVFVLFFGILVCMLGMVGRD